MHGTTTPAIFALAGTLQALGAGTATPLSVPRINAAGTAWEQAVVMDLGTAQTATAAKTFSSQIVANGGITSPTSGGSLCEKFGAGSSAATSNATAVGANATAGQRCTVVGRGASASFQGVAVGNVASAGGNASIAFGESSSASGLGAVAIGVGAVASHASAFVFGLNGISTRDQQVVFSCSGAFSVAPEILFQGASSTTTGIPTFGFTSSWISSTHATRRAQVDWKVFDTAERIAISIAASGSAAMLGFYGATAAIKQTITGSRGSNAALADLLTKLATIGLITDSTS